MSVYRSLIFSAFFILFASQLIGCGGHEGGTLEIPADNPYQLSPAEEAQRMQARSAAFEARMAAEKAAEEAAAAEQSAQNPEATQRTTTNAQGQTVRVPPQQTQRPAEDPESFGRYAQ